MKRLICLLTLVPLAIAILCSAESPAQAAGPLAIKAGKLIPIAGDPIENAVVLIRDGKIVAVGADVEIPVEATVIDASDMVVMPGFVDPHNPDGMSQANERNTNVPFLSAVDSIDPVLNYFEDCRRSGITTTAVVPGNSTMIGGRGAILKSAGSYVDDMLLRREAGLKISLAPIGGSRMSHLARLRRELDKAKRSLEDDSNKEDASDSEPVNDKAADEQPADKDEEKADDAKDEKADSEEKSQPSEEDVDEGLKVLQLALKGELPVFIYCAEAMDVGHALRLAEQYNLDPIFVLGRDCYQAAGMLKDLTRPVILDPTLVYWETDPLTRTDKQVVVPKKMMEAGVPFVFQTTTSTRQTVGSGFLWYQAATCVKYGMSVEDALHAMTLGPAKLLGVEQFVGSIEPGKDADLVILTGDPLAVDTWVDQTLVNGEVVYKRSEDQKLKRLLEEPAE